MKKCLLATLIYFVIGFSCNLALADHRDPEDKTNVNSQTDLFENSIGDVRGFETQIDSGKDSAVKGLGSSEALIGEIGGKNESGRSEVESLKSIRANDLESAGVKAVNESNIMNEIYFDETKALYREHRKDAVLIADSSKDLLDNLLIQIKDMLGVDCKQVKGKKIVEPQFYIDVKKKQDMDAKYDQHICEELRNQYHCRDELTVKCVRRGFKEGPWQYRTIRISGAELHHAKEAWGFAKFREHKEWDWYITPYHPKPHAFFGYMGYQVGAWVNEPNLIINDARNYISAKLGIPLNQIREDIVFPPEGRGVGPLFWGVGRWRKVWTEYEFGYYYRDLTSVCEVWQEDWNEVCKL